MKNKEQLLFVWVMLAAANAFGGNPKWISGDTKAAEKPAPIVYRDFRLDAGQKGQSILIQHW